MRARAATRRRDGATSGPVARQRVFPVVSFGTASDPESLRFGQTFVYTYKNTDRQTQCDQNLLWQKFQRKAAYQQHGRHQRCQPLGHGRRRRCSGIISNKATFCWWFQSSSSNRFKCETILTTNNKHAQINSDTVLRSVRCETPAPKYVIRPAAFRAVNRSRLGEGGNVTGGTRRGLNELTEKSRKLPSSPPRRAVIVF